jgi:hypothetical protein
MDGRVILDLCAGTGAWSQPYLDAGYTVIRLTLPEADVRLVHRLPGKVHGILAAPPCTVFANSGARWPRTQEQMLEGLSVMDACLRAVTIYEPEWWALENPVVKMRRYLGDPTLIFDPCDYGDPYTKKTLLWKRFTLPAKSWVTPLGGRPGQPNAWFSKVGGTSDKTKAYRSATPPGFARAFFEANP